MEFRVAAAQHQRLARLRRLAHLPQQRRAQLLLLGEPPQAEAVVAAAEVVAVVGVVVAAVAPLPQSSCIARSSRIGFRKKGAVHC